MVNQKLVLGLRNLQAFLVIDQRNSVDTGFEFFLLGGFTKRKECDYEARH
jgi:hypothetical protein